MLPLMSITVIRNACVCLILFIFFGCSKNSQNLKIKGSDTEVNLAVELGEAFYKVYPDVHVSISGGGSGLGIASLLNGQADIANSSRPLKDEEIVLFEKNGIKLRTIVFAEDATAIVVNTALPFNEIGTDTLARIFSGEIKNWQEIGGPNLPVNIYGRQSNSGTHSFVQKKLNIKFSSHAKEMNGNAQILEGIKSDPSGIGYVGAGYLSSIENNKVKPLNIRDASQQKAIDPLDEAAIKAGIYFFQRPLYQFIPESSWQKAKVFIDFEKGAVGQKIIQNSGYYVNDAQ